MRTKRQQIEIIDAGVSDFRETYKLQRDLLQKRIEGSIGDTCVIAEHRPVITIGRLGSRENILSSSALLVDAGIEVIDTDRGGDVTMHAPGQLVAYPIVDLKILGRDLRLYMRRLEEALMRFLESYGIRSFRIEGATGVWTGRNNKIASIGIAVKSWVSYHGLSVNINTPLQYFDAIRPCGIDGCRMTSAQEILGRPLDMADAKKRLAGSIIETFGEWEEESHG